MFAILHPSYPFRSVWVYLIFGLKGSHCTKSNIRMHVSTPLSTLIFRLWGLFVFISWYSLSEFWKLSEYCCLSRWFQCNLICIWSLLLLKVFHMLGSHPGFGFCGVVFYAHLCVVSNLSTVSALCWPCWASCFLEALLSCASAIHVWGRVVFLCPSISLLVVPNLIDIALFLGACRYILYVCSGAIFNFCYAIYLFESEVVTNFDGISMNDQTLSHILEHPSSFRLWVSWLINQLFFAFVTNFSIVMFPCFRVLSLYLVTILLF